MAGELCDAELPALRAPAALDDFRGGWLRLGPRSGLGPYPGLPFRPYVFEPGPFAGGTATGLLPFPPGAATLAAFLGGAALAGIFMLLSSLAHNVIVWARHWLASPALHHYGMLRMVRDVFHISGFLLTDACGQVVQLVLNQAAPLAPALVDPLRQLLAGAHMAVNLGQT